MLAVHDRMLPIWERRLAGLLPVIAYAPEDFEREVRSFVDLLESRPLEGGNTAWPELSEWATWWLGYACGAFALFQESWSALATLLPVTFSNWNGSEIRLIDPLRENVGHEVGKRVMARLSDTPWHSPRWEHLLWSLSNGSVLKERWSEFLQGQDPQFAALGNFDFLVSIRVALDGDAPVAHWSMSRRGAVPIARRLRSDPRYRAEVAKVLGVKPDELVTLPPIVLQNIRAPGGFSNSEAINVLVEGRE